jgi:4-hydroxybenzoyl-CoA thioesterase/acyl-CoA thioester hydrolase
MSQEPGEPIHEFRSRRRIEFADTDMGGIVHFSRFFVFMETAEHELLRSLGAEVHMQLEGRDIGWPRVEANCQYLSPARLADVLDIHLRVVRKGHRSMTYAFTFTCDERIVARGRLSSVCCTMSASDGLAAIPIPAFIADRLREPPEIA